MLTEDQIMTAYELKRQGKAYREIAQAVGLDGKTQHSQVVSALGYFVMGYQAAARETGTGWTERAICFGIGTVFNMAITAIIFLI